MYPVNLNLKGREVLIVGGGRIALRKARKLLAEEAKLKVLSQEFIGEFYELDCEKILRQYSSSDLDGKFLVFAATSDKELNSEIARECHKRNIAVNNVSDSLESSFINQGSLELGGLSLGISTAGAYPALTKYIMEDLKERYMNYDEEYLGLLEEIRSLALEDFKEDKDEIINNALSLNKLDLKNYLKQLRERRDSVKIRVGTRGSNLAVTQTGHVVDMLKEKFPELEFEIKTIKTTGDILNNVALDKIGGKEVFIKEIERELLDEEIDLAIHSMKDVPGELPEGLRLSFIPKREDHRDVLVLRSEYESLADLREGARIGTGSKRRMYQLLSLRPDLEIVPIRGNVQTRIEKIYSEELDGVILAYAGIKRLGIEDEIEENIYVLSDDELLASPCQGILALEIREDDERLHSLIKEIGDEVSLIQAQAERAFLRGTGGSCHVPVAAHCVVEDERVLLKGLLGDEDGNELVSGEISGPREDAEKLGLKLAEKITKELGI